MYCCRSSSVVVFGGTTNGEIFAWQVSRAGLVTLKKIVQNSFGSIIALDYNHNLDVLSMGTSNGYVLLSDKMSDELESNKRDTNNTNITTRVRRLSSTTSLAQSPDNNSNNKTNTIRNVKNLKIEVHNNISNDERNSIIRKQRRRRSNSFTDDTVDNILNKLVEKYESNNNTNDDDNSNNNNNNDNNNNEKNIYKNMHQPSLVPMLNTAISTTNNNQVVNNAIFRKEKGTYLQFGLGHTVPNYDIKPKIKDGKRMCSELVDEQELNKFTHEIVNTVDRQGEILDKLNEEMNETRKDISKAYLLMMKHKGGSFIFD